MAEENPSFPDVGREDGRGHYLDLVPDGEENQSASVEQSAPVTAAPAERPVVLVFGLRPERLLDSEGRIDAFLEPPDAEQVGVLVEAPLVRACRRAAT